MTAKKQRKKRKRTEEEIQKEAFIKREEVIDLATELAEEKEIKTIRDASERISRVTDYKPGSVRDIIEEKAPEKIHKKLKKESAGQLTKKEIEKRTKEAKQKLKEIEDEWSFNVYRSKLIKEIGPRQADDIIERARKKLEKKNGK